VKFVLIDTLHCILQHPYVNQQPGGQDHHVRENHSTKWYRYA